MTAHIPTVMLSPHADVMYKAMVDGADPSGFVDFEQCLTISVEQVEEGKAVDGVRELEHELLVFASPDNAGWFVRMPVRHVKVTR